ncbi:MAG: hypothetical protein ACRCWQ_07965, partial [Bacilli bacterium]
ETKLQSQSVREGKEIESYKKRLLLFIEKEITFIFSALEGTSVSLRTFVVNRFGNEGLRIFEKIDAQGIFQSMSSQHKMVGISDAKSIFNSLSEAKAFQIAQAWKHVMFLEMLIVEVEEKLKS